MTSPICLERPVAGTRWRSSTHTTTRPLNPGIGFVRQLRPEHPLHLQRRCRLRRAYRRGLDLRRGCGRRTRNRRSVCRTGNEQHLHPERLVDRRHAHGRHLSQRAPDDVVGRVRVEHLLRTAHVDVGPRLRPGAGVAHLEAHRADGLDDVSLPVCGAEQRRHHVRPRLHSAHGNPRVVAAGKQGGAYDLRQPTARVADDGAARELERHRHRLRLPVAAQQRRRGHLVEHLGRDGIDVRAGAGRRRCAGARLCIGDRPRWDRERGQQRCGPGRHGPADQHRRPSVIGSAQVGATLTAGVGSWDPAAETFTYSWQRAYGSGGFQAIPGATRSTYAVAPNDLGDTIRVIVTATNPDGTAAVISPPTAAIAPAPPAPVAPAPSSPPRRPLRHRPPRPGPSPCPRCRAAAVSVPT